MVTLTPITISVRRIVWFLVGQMTFANSSLTSLRKLEIDIYGLSESTCVRY